MHTTTFKVVIDEASKARHAHDFNDPEQVISCFDQIDWFQQADQVGEDDLSPTFTICNNVNQKTMWASVIGDRSEIQFAVEAELDLNITKKFLGLFKTTSQAVIAESALTKAQTRSMIKDFVEGNHQKIYTEYH